MIARMLCFCLLIVLGGEAFAESPEYIDRLGTTIREIHLLNLLKALELTGEQKRVIVQKAEEAGRIRDEFFASQDYELAQSLRVLEKLRDVLLSGKNTPKDLKKQVRRAGGLQKKLRKELYEKRIELAFEIKEVLEPHQLYTLNNYVPCIIPPKEGAAGQVKGSEGIVKRLARIRELPEKVFERRKNDLASGAVEGIRKRLPMPRGYILDKEAEKRWLLSLYEEVRNMSDIDFSLRKDELGERLKSRHALPKLPLAVWVKIEKFLLVPEIIPLLER